MAENVRSIASGRYSWLRYAKTERVVDGASGRPVTFFGLPELPVFRSGSGDTQYTVKAFEKIEAIAQRVYGNVELWWVIAEANGMTLPDADMYEGRVLLIPDPAVVRQTLGVSG
jgi:nucleoid-associated protein YgaU